MTLLMFDQTPSSAMVFTDTLVVDVKDQPLLFRSKVWIFPQLNMVMAVTGAANIGDAWDIHLRDRRGVRDIEGVVTGAPATLRKIFGTLTEMHGKEIGSATVYLFGFPHGTGEMVRYIFRSIEDFKPERYVGDIFAVKPRPKSFTAAYPETNDEVIALAERVQAENRVPIGGELHITQIEDGKIISARMHQFPGYEEAWAKMRASAT